jgi:hypothetical protein
VLLLRVVVGIGELCERVIAAAEASTAEVPGAGFLFRLPPRGISCGWVEMGT